ncbi:MAG: hypothetical protein QOC63_389 [Mycobacterium sp.]|jgi:hypothetical protein|nr:hypothetical protein [Mycobacterium sp.]
MLSKIDKPSRRDAHAALHSEHGAARGDRPDRSPDPVIKIHDLAWLEFEKPDLNAAERFAHDFRCTFAAAAQAPNASSFAKAGGRGSSVQCCTPPTAMTSHDWRTSTTRWCSSATVSAAGT